MLLSNLSDPIIPIFMALLAGYVMRKNNIFDVISAQAINRFVFYMALPALAFSLIARVPLGEIDWPTITSYLSSELIVYAGVAITAYRLFNLSAGESLLIGMSASFVNHLLFVLPIAQSLYGSMASKPIAAIVFIDTIIFCLTVLTLDLIKAKKSEPNQGYSSVGVIKLLGKNPLVIAMSLGVVAGITPQYIPSGVFTYTMFVGSAAAPASLFALGIILAGQSIRPIGAPTWLAVSAKLIIHPIVLTLIGGVTLLKPEWQKMAFLVAAGPCGAMPFVIALQYGVKTEVIAKAVLISTTLSLLSLSFLTAR